jgi:hypothetical protein
MDGGLGENEFFQDNNRMSGAPFIGAGGRDIVLVMF